MKIFPSLLSLALASTVVTGCTTKKYYTTPDGGESAATPSVSGASPSSAFLGRTLDVTLSGSETNWSSSTTVSFGDKITVNKLTVASASALVANITVDPAAAIGPRDVTVTDGTTSEPYKMAFNVSEAASLTLTGDAKQGSLMIVTIKNNDLTHLFDTTSTGDGLTTPIVYTNINIATSTGVSFVINNVTQFEIDGLIEIDTTAKTGAADFDIQSGPAGGTVDHFYYPAAINVAAQTATTLTNNATINIADVLGSQLFTFTPTVNHQYTFTANDGTLLVQLDSTGAFPDSLDPEPTVSFLATDATPIYLVVLDDSGNTMNSDSVAITDVAFNVATETSDTMNNAKGGAQTIAPPALVQNAQLSSATDQDWYKITTTASNIISAVTSPGDDSTDTVVTIYADDGTTVIAASSDQDYFDSVVTADAQPAGTYYIVVTYSTDPNAAPWSAGESHYDLAVTLQ